MPKPKRPSTIEDVIDFIEANAPSEDEEAKKNPFKGRRFDYELVDAAIEELHREKRFLDLEAYDLRGTNRLWNTIEGTNFDLARRATKKLLKVLQEQNPDKTLEQILPTITTEYFQKTPINRYQSTNSGMAGCVYDNSPYDALKDLIENDPELTEFRDFQPYDMRYSPQNTWNKKDGTKNYELARQAVKQLIKKLQEQNPDKTLEQILPTITQADFAQTPINRYKTTLSGMIQHTYESSPYAALKDLIDNDPEFENFRDFEPYDMSQAPQETWQGEEGKKIARKATKVFVKKLQEENPGKKIEEILPTITQDMFYTKPINRYGTTLGGMTAFNRSPYEALKDLIENDDEFREYRDFQSYDMLQPPRETWQGEEGKKIARKATKVFVKKLQEENPGKKIEEILPAITARMLLNKPINKYGTTIYGMMIQAYDDSPYAALKDLIDNDTEFEQLRDLQPYDMETSPHGTWQGEEGKKTARKATRQLLKALQEEQPDISLQQIIANITAKTIWETPINKYKTTLRGMLGLVYRNSPYQALKDLAEHNDEYRKYLPIIEELKHKVA